MASGEYKNETGSSIVQSAVTYAFESINYDSVGGSPITQYPARINGLIVRQYTEVDKANPNLSDANGYNKSGQFLYSDTYGGEYDVFFINMDALPASTSGRKFDRLVGTIIHESLHDSEVVEKKANDIARSMNLIGFTPAEKELARTIVEEAVIRSTIARVGASNEDFTVGRGNFGSFAELIRMYNGKQIVINGEIVTVKLPPKDVELLRREMREIGFEHFSIDEVTGRATLKNFNVVGKSLSAIGDGIVDFLDAIGKAVDDILSGDAFKGGGRVLGPGFVGNVSDGHSVVKTYDVVREGGGGPLTIYGEGQFKDQKYQPGGDWDGDGSLTASDKQLHDADMWDRQAGAARAISNYDAAEEYDRKAEEARQRAVQSSSSGDSDSSQSGGGSQSSKPILLDLNGNGIEIAEFDKSTIFMDGGEGLLHRTAWAGAGDGVLFYDAGNDGKITEKREFVFTDWSPTAGGDLEALRAVFDTNGDGKLTAADTDFSKFKVMVTNADGSTSAVTLASLGITEINLTANAVNIVMADGSTITGQTTYTKADGTTGTVANTTLVADAAGCIIC